MLRYRISVQVRLASPVMLRLPVAPIRRVVVGLAAVVVLVGLAASPAAAHAELVSTDPADGVVLDAAPRQVGLQFTERVSVQPDGVRVLDASGDRVDDGAARANDTRVTVPLQKLARGSYLVSWRVVSADGHPVRGAFTFSIGEQSTIGSDVASGAFGRGDDRTYEQAAAVLRVLAYLATLVAAGLVLVGGALRTDDGPSPVTGRVAALLGIGLASLLGQVVLQASLATGEGLDAVFNDGVLGLALADGVGWSLLCTSIGLLCMLVCTGLPFEGVARKVASAGAVLGPLGFLLTGHTRTMSPAAVAYLADAAHLAGAAVWFGGLVATIVIVRRRRADDDPFGAAEAIAQFSGWAAISAGVVAVSGGALAWIEVGSLHALTTTTYGLLLIAKVGSVVLVLCAATWNRFRLVPAVAAAAIEEPPRDHHAAWATLVWLMRIEIALLVAVVAFTGVLTNVTPAKGAADRGPVTVSAPLGEGSVDVTIDPSRPGRNDIHAGSKRSGNGQTTFERRQTMTWRIIQYATLWNGKRRQRHARSSKQSLALSRFYVDSINNPRAAIGFVAVLKDKRLARRIDGKVSRKWR